MDFEDEGIMEGEIPDEPLSDDEEGEIPIINSVEPSSVSRLRPTTPREHLIHNSYHDVLRLGNDVISKLTTSQVVEIPPKPEFPDTSTSLEYHKKNLFKIFKGALIGFMLIFLILHALWYVNIISGCQIQIPIRTTTVEITYSSFFYMTRDIRIKTVEYICILPQLQFAN